MAHDEQIVAIAGALERRQVILFVGAGISMNVGLPSWTCLIDHMLMDLGLPSSFAVANGTTYQEIAEYYRLKHGSLSQFGRLDEARVADFAGATEKLGVASADRGTGLSSRLHDELRFKSRDVL